MQHPVVANNAETDYYTQLFFNLQQAASIHNRILEKISSLFTAGEYQLLSSPIFTHAIYSPRYKDAPDLIPEIHYMQNLLDFFATIQYLVPRPSQLPVDQVVRFQPFQLPPLTLSLLQP